MQAIRLRLPELVRIELQKFEDPRGWFMMTWERQSFAAAGIDAEFVQDNQSRSRQWTLRGLHYQLRHPQGKLVRVLAGRIFDVAVDVRRSSPSFGEWVGTELSAATPAQLWIPSGFAHGFLALEPDSEVLYKTTDIWAPEWERTVAWNDPSLAIDWPIPDGIVPLLSGKDSNAGRLSEVETYP
jgi:dTDP-4-dehydrorhamnose 3,5-epimerase